MSLKIIKEEKLNKIVINSYTHPLEIEKEGIYLIEVTALIAERSLELFNYDYRSKIE